MTDFIRISLKGFSIATPEELGQSTMRIKFVKDHIKSGQLVTDFIRFLEGFPNATFLKRWGCLRFHLKTQTKTTWFSQASLWGIQDRPTKIIKCRRRMKKEEINAKGTKKEKCLVFVRRKYKTHDWIGCNEKSPARWLCKVYINLFARVYIVFLLPSRCHNIDN